MYRGRKVLERADVPVLNVEYDAGGCGCYRDWQDSESVFETTAAAGGTTTAYYTDATAGSVRTNCERRTAPSSDPARRGRLQRPQRRPQPDAGSFRGVAAEDYGRELVLTDQGAPAGTGTA